ncbi:hypothetical protein [Desulfoluna sp.]|uniref:hypothetical protein n=1 Tax=Desulfoluna sp. TaxID=2045199 RepID=UPI00262E7D79|nr:hypothetical protein [Desulfoluna sp.]
MKKQYMIVTLICSLVVLSGAVSSQAQIVPMSDSQLAGITGQAGFSPQGSYSDLQRNAGTNNMHLGGLGAALHLSDASYQIERTGEVSAIRMAANGTSYSFEIKNPGLTLRNFQTRLHIGNQPGTGNSLGTVSVEHIRVTTHGTVRITVK